MAKTNRKINKKAFVVLALLVIMTAIMLFLRGPYVSNMLKMRVLSRISVMTGKQFIADRIYINLLPLYVEAANVRAFDEKGTRLLSIKRAKAYVGLSGIFQRKIELSQVVLVKPEVWATRETYDEIVGNVTKSLQKKPSTDERTSIPFAVNVGSVVVKRGELSFHDEGRGILLTMSRADVEVLLRENPEVRFSIGSITPIAEGWPLIDVDVEGNALVTKQAVEFRSLTIKQDNSSIHAIGAYNKDGTGNMSIDMLLDVATVKHALELKRTGAGTLHARGSISSAGDIKNPILDLKAWGDFHLETLIEAIGLGDYPYPLSGHADFDGSVKGPVRNLNGTADARMTRANIYDVEIDTLEGNVQFKDSVLLLKDIKATLYNGTAQAEVSLPLPHPVPYSVDVRFQDVNSDAALKIARIEWLALPQGKVTGTFRTSGEDFNPSGEAFYTAGNEPEGPLAMVRTLQGRYALEGHMLSLDGFQVQADAASLKFDGTLNTETSELAFTGDMQSSDISRLVQPYLPGLGGSGNITVSVGGTVKSPVALAKLSVRNAAYRKYDIGDIEGTLSYAKGVLDIRKAIAKKDARTSEVSGKVAFPVDDGIPRFKEGDYDLAVQGRNESLKDLLVMLGFDVPVEGAFDTALSIHGKGNQPIIDGDATLTDVSVYGRSIAEVKLRYGFKEGLLSVQDAEIREDESLITLSGSISMEGAYDFELESERIPLSSLMEKEFPVNYDLTVNAHGKGTLKNPDIDVSVGLHNGRFLEQDIGEGFLKATLHDHSFAGEGTLADGKLRFQGKALFEGDTPWSARLDIAHGRYDYLIGSFMKQIPEDLMLNVHGTIEASGTKDNINAKAVIDRLNMNMFGQGFRTVDEIRVDVVNSDVRLSRFALQSGSTYIEAGGHVAIGSSYDITVEGSSALAPLVAVVDKLEAVRGEVDFVFSVTGGWDAPLVNGGLSLTQAGFGIKGFPHHFNKVDAFIYFDQGKAVINRIKSEMGGGDIEASGAVYFDGLAIRRFYLDALMNNVTLSLSHGLTTNLGGNILFRGTPKGQTLSGEVRINRALYSDRIEWKRRLLDFRQESPKGAGAWPGNIALNLRVYGDRNIKVDNNVIQASLSPDIIVKGIIASPRYYGRIESEEGKVYFKNNEFRIISATADYADDPISRPYIRVYAETYTQGYHVWLTVEGKAEKYDLVLASDPPLDEVALLGLLTVGETGEGSEGFAGGIGAAEATSFLTGELQDVTEERVRTLTGFDRVQIDPYVSKTTGTITPRVTVTKKLGGEKLAVTYSKSVGTEEQEVKLEYLLNENVSLLGGQNDLGSLGADVKFRFRFK